MSRVYEDADEGYATACSDVTLCSNSKGFFKELGDELISIAGEDWLRTLERAPEGKKVQLVTENQKIMDELNEVLSRIRPLHRGKSANVSRERRLASARTLLAGSQVQALALASQAVLRAPMTGVEEGIDNGVSLALALWQRSEVLLAMNLCSAAVEDLRLALKERLPVSMRAVYYRRLGDCYRGAGAPTRAKVSYELAVRLLGSNEEAKAEVVREIECLDCSVTPQQPPDRAGIPVTGGSKHNMPSLSKLVKICEEETKGRFAVADSEIHTGDVLLVDSPYAACLLPDYQGSHCLHCFRRLIDCETSAPVWCPRCVGVAFCSVQCRDQAVTTYHSYECQYLDLFIGSGMSVLSHIALRMVTQAGLDTSLSIHSKYILNEMKKTAINDDIEGVTKKSNMRTRKERLNRSKKGLKHFDEIKKEESKVDDKMSLEEKLELKAAQIYSLCTHWEQRNGSDYLKRIVMAMFLTETLKQAGFFKKCDTANVEKAQAAICELILRNLQLLQFNAHEIYETIRGQHQFTGSKPVYIAVAIYPTGALFNHECYPAVARYFEGRNIVLRATRPLVPGEMVSENYGPHFMLRGARERQRSLACRYWFRCQCPACEEQWPTMKQMQEGHVYLRCPNMCCPWKFRPSPQCLPSRCAKCSTQIDPQLVKICLDTVDRCADQYKEGAKLMEEQKGEEAIEVMSAAIDQFHAVARPPHRETHLAQEALRSCYAAAGSVHVVSGGESPPGDSGGEHPPGDSGRGTLAIEHADAK